MLARVKLTQAKLDDFKVKAGKAQSFLWDTVSPGLGVRATAGKKVFVFQGRVEGSRVPIRLTIGDVNTWTLDREMGDPPEGALYAPGEGARQAARRLQALCDVGIDPRQQQTDILAAAEAKRAAQMAELEANAAEVAAAATTFGDAWNAYVVARTPEWGSLHMRDHASVARVATVKTTAGPINSLLAVPLAELTPELVDRWVRQEKSIRPTTGALGYRLLRACLRWAATQARYKALVRLDAVGSEVARAVAKPKAKAGDCMQREMLEPWFREVRKLGPTVSAYLQCLLLLGPRRGELATLKWEHVDFQWLKITLADKIEDERVIPMTPYVKLLLLDLRRRNNTPPQPTRILHGKRIDVDVEGWEPSKFVFSSPTSKTGRLVEPTIAHNRALKAAGLPHVSLHGLRRSFSTLSEWIEVPVGVVAQIQGHKPSAIAERHYIFRPIDLLRMWHTKIEAWILHEALIDLPAPQERRAALQAV